MVALEKGVDTQAAFSCAMVGSTREHVRPPPSGSRLKACMGAITSQRHTQHGHLHTHALLASQTQRASPFTDSLKLTEHICDFALLACNRHT